MLAPRQRHSPEDAPAGRNDEPSLERSAAVMLDERGKIQDCEGAVEELFGYHNADLVSRHISVLLPELAKLSLLENGQVNSHFRYHCRLGCSFRAMTREGESFDSLLTLNDLGNDGDHRLRLIVCRPG